MWANIPTSAYSHPPTTARQTRSGGSNTRAHFGAHYTSRYTQHAHFGAITYERYCFGSMNGARAYGSCTYSFGGMRHLSPLRANPSLSCAQTPYKFNLQSQNTLLILKLFSLSFGPSDLRLLHDSGRAESTTPLAQYIEGERSTLQRGYRFRAWLRVT